MRSPAALSASSFALMLALAIPAVAETGIDPEALLDREIAAFAASHDAFDTMRLDLNQSGVDEVLAIETGDCAPDGCAWALFAFDGEQALQIGAGEGSSMRLEPTGEAGGIVYIDGVTWAFDGRILYPFGDVISLVRNRATAADELAQLRALPGLEALEREAVMSWTFSYQREDGIAHAQVHTINSWEYQVGSWGTPYYIMDSDGEVIARGHSTDAPRIFPDTERGGFTIVDVVPIGFSMQTFR